MFEESVRYIQGAILENVDLITDPDVDGITALTIARKSYSRSDKLNLIFLDRQMLDEEIKAIKGPHVKAYDAWYMKDSIKNNSLKEILKKESIKSFVVADHHPFNLNYKHDKYHYLKNTSIPSGEFALNELKIANKKLGLKIKKFDFWEDLATLSIISDYYAKNHPGKFDLRLLKLKKRYPNLIGEDLVNVGTCSDMMEHLLDLLNTGRYVKAKEISDILFNLAENKIKLDMLFNQDYKPMKPIQYIFRRINTQIINNIERFKSGDYTFYSDKNVALFYVKSDYRISSKVSNKIANRNPTKLILVIHKMPEYTKIEVRDRMGRYNLNKILENTISNLRPVGRRIPSGGGHEKAAGAEFHKKDLDAFLRNFFNELNKR